MRLTVPISLPVRRGLDELRQALEYASDLQLDRWDFAVELSCLIGHGLTLSELRWLVCKGFAEHGEEQGPAEKDGRRQFVISKNLGFSKKTCFVLTDNGYQALYVQAGLEKESKILRTDPGCRTESIQPHWNASLHELTFAGGIVKRFRQSSPNQEAVLAAFEEAGWPDKIADPLPQVAGVKRKKRLLETIRSLNTNQKRHVVHFLAAEDARSVGWRLRTGDESR